MHAWIDLRVVMYYFFIFLSPSSFNLSPSPVAVRAPGRKLNSHVACGPNVVCAVGVWYPKLSSTHLTNIYFSIQVKLDKTANNKPSRVIHIRNIPNEVTEAEVIHLGIPFGKVTNVLVLKGKNQVRIHIIFYIISKLFIIKIML